MLVTKTKARSRVHRIVPMDYVGVKQYGPDGKVTGEHRFVGLFTAAAYSQPVNTIPGITARGAWKSVKRHFRELGINQSLAHLRRSGPGPRGGGAEGTQATVRQAAIRVDRLQPRSDFIRRRRLPAEREVDPDIGADEGSLRHHAGHASAQRTDPRLVGRRGRPVVDRRHRHLRQGLRRARRRGGRPRQRRAPSRRAQARLQGGGGRRQPRLHTQRGRIEFALSGGGGGADQYRRGGQLRGRGLFGPRGQHQNPDRAAHGGRRLDAPEARQAAGIDDRRGCVAGVA